MTLSMFLSSISAAMAPPSVPLVPSPSSSWRHRYTPLSVPDSQQSRYIRYIAPPSAWPIPKSHHSLEVRAARNGDIRPRSICAIDPSVADCRSVCRMSVSSERDRCACTCEGREEGDLVGSEGWAHGSRWPDRVVGYLSGVDSRSGHSACRGSRERAIELNHQSLSDSVWKR